MRLLIPNKGENQRPYGAERPPVEGEAGGLGGRGRKVEGGGEREEARMIPK